jgi:AcrR family transcriptional regulator
MGISERKEREREDRRTAILETAKALILERGAADLSMQDIAGAAELSKATLYLYFDSKDALFKAILGEAVEAFAAYVEARIAPDASGLDALKALWGSYLSLFGASADVFVLTGIRNYVAGSGGFSPAAQRGPFEGRLTELIAGVLARGAADGTLEASLDGPRLARIALTIAMAIIDEAARQPRETRDAAAIRSEMKLTFELLLRGLAAPGTDRTLLSLDGED